MFEQPKASALMFRKSTLFQGGLDDDLCRDIKPFYRHYIYHGY